MSGLFGGGNTTTEGQRFGALQIQSASQGLALPIIYGTVKTSSNLIWYGDFTVIRHESKQGGKGGPSVTSVSYTYTVALIMGVCEGEISSYGKVWMNQGVSSPAALGFSEFVGSPTQTPWGYMVTKHPTEALPYKNVAYLCNSSFDLGSNPYLPQMWIEVAGKFVDTAVTDNDADPALVIIDLLINEQFGAKFPIEYIDYNSFMYADSSYSNYCGALGIGFSFAVNQNKACREYLNDFLAVTNTAAVWSGDQLKLIPYGDKETSGNGKTYVPLNQVRYDLTDNDFLTEMGDDPVVVSRIDPYDCYNHVRLETVDKTNQYNLSVSEAKDQASIEQIGLRTLDKKDAHFLSTPTMGAMCVELIKNRVLYVRNKYKFMLSWEYALLEPMDIVTLTQADTGLDKTPVRIVAITENDKGLLEFEAEEFIEGTQWSVQYPSQENTGYVGDAFVDAGDAYAPIIFEPKSNLIGNSNGQVWLITAGNPDTWGGAFVWISTDGESYTQVGTVNAGSRMGTLTANLNTYGGSNPDTVNTLSVDISASGGSFVTVSSSDAIAGRSLCYVDGELISYTTATLTGTGLYNLTGLYRGQYGSTIGSHASGTKFAALDNTVFKYTLPVQSYVGQTIYIKLTSFNLFAMGVQNLADVPAYSYVITGVGNQTNFVIQGSASGKPAASAVVVTYVAPNAFQVPASLAGTVVSVGTNPTATATFTVRKNGSLFGQIVISTAGAITLTGSATTFATGDILTIVAPTSQDATLANVAFGIAATKL